MSETAHSGGKHRLASYNEKVGRDHLVGNWVVEPYVSSLTDGPEPNCEPHVWRWDTVRPYLLETFDVLPDNAGARRNLSFLNPALPRGTTHTLSAGVQLIGPGELAPTHGHSMNAMRFVIEGSPELYTVVDGLKCPMEDHDLILTPSYCWHDHHNAADHVVSWLDVLDVSLYVRLNQMFFVPYGAPEQPVRNAPADAGPGWLRPGWDAAGGGKPLRYPWRGTEARLRALADAEDGSPTEGVVLDYIDPTTGGPAFPTMRCAVQLLRPGHETVAWRRTASAIHFIIGGAGRTVVGDRELTWGRHDCVCVPNWMWHRHINLSAEEDALIFTVTDAPVLRALGMYREETAQRTG